MSKKTTRIRLSCFDGEYEFQLRMAGCQAIEGKAGVGIGAVYGQVLRGRFIGPDGAGFGVPAESAFSVPVLLEIVRQGLIGGGKGFTDGNEVLVTAPKANMLISTYLDPDSGNIAMEAWDIAAAVIHAFMEGVDVPDAPETNNEVAPADGGLTAGAAEV